MRECFRILHAFAIILLLLNPSMTKVVKAMSEIQSTIRTSSAAIVGGGFAGGPMIFEDPNIIENLNYIFMIPS